MTDAARVLLVDNHDSYTYNVFQLLASVFGGEPDVVTNDDSRWSGLDLDAYDAAVVSPGPGQPGRATDFGHSATVFEHGGIPVLGVCLGHQGLGAAAGARVVPAPHPRHGHLSTVTHSGDGLFAGIPQGFTAVRYHSLCLAEPLPPELDVLASAEDGVVMAVRHRVLPWWGVQFHPESVASEHGAQLVANFRVLAGVANQGRARTTRAAAVPPRVRPVSAAPLPTAPRLTPAPISSPTPTGQIPRPVAAPEPTVVTSPAVVPPLRIRSTSLPREVDTQAVFDRLYGDRDPHPVFWLDSARTDSRAGRFSFLGDISGPRGELLDYTVGHDQVTVHRPGFSATVRPGGIFDVLPERLRERTVEPSDDLPFDFQGGYVGYFGYELKSDCGASANRHIAAGPDAQWMFCDRFVAVDHQERRTYAVALCDAGDEADQAAAQAWLDATARSLTGLPDAAVPTEPTDPDAPGDPTAYATAPPDPSASGMSGATPRRSERQYLADIATCRQRLAEGESYEICLTDTLTAPAPADPAAYYRRLRALSPAPYAALLKFADTQVMSASPERFLRVDRHRVAESRPIKGTAPRGPDPATDEALRSALQTDPKTRAENLMIVDLVRNDLGRVCTVGSVEVDGFLATESYAAVHQLVSTIRGALRPDVDAVACARACFPGGSMTGAPKLRTMEIIDSLETGPRGVYSGALGYFSASGTADLAIVIRTAVLRGDVLSIGAGGAIVLASEPADEYAEMRLKAATTLRPLADHHTLSAGTSG
ncbi:aminodeoxychorismate synthase component I [Streptodolium elevatio]|uniref:aminodeoxychorismate synthase n=1 Tax=Streptodolium elevatio TaxID=3157996 RepID=A0ABV3DJM7_9ACTN